MRELLVVSSGLLAGVVAWLPFSVGLAAHRYQLGGARFQSRNRWVQIAMRDPGSFTALGRAIFVLVMVIWVCVFFGAMGVPVLVARALGVSEDSQFIGYGIFANLLVAVGALFAGPAIWRRLAL